MTTPDPARTTVRSRRHPAAGPPTATSGAAAAPTRLVATARVVTALALAAVLATLPLLASLATGPGDLRYRWAMFHGAAPPPTYAVETADGWQDVEVADHVGWPVRHVPYGTAVPHRLCQAIDGARTVRRVGQDATEVVPCAR